MRRIAATAVLIACVKKVFFSTESSTTPSISYIVVMKTCVSTSVVTTIQKYSLRRANYLCHSVSLRTRGWCRGEGSCRGDGTCRGESRLGIRTQDIVCAENDEEEKRAHATCDTESNHFQLVLANGDAPPSLSCRCWYLGQGAMSVMWRRVGESLLVYFCNDLEEQVRY